MKLRLATRESPLALWQAEHVKERLGNVAPEVDVELVPMTTRGDQLLNQPLAEIGGKGLFLKELEQAMLEDRADFAVHSLKDVPYEMPEGFELACVLERHDPRDALVSGQVDRLAALPEGAKVGTSSLRRRAQLLNWRSDLKIDSLRGNVNTRLKKLDAGEYDAIILATAGLERLDMADRIAERIDPEQSLPAVGQGVVAVECRAGDNATQDVLKRLHHMETALCIRAERAFSAALGGSCQLPMAAMAQRSGDRLSLEGLVASEDGQQLLRRSAEGAADEPEALGEALAATLREAGADQILDALR
ncbi:MAG: hydroxymethylbilane synthase [Pseudomonadota bacterium]